MTIQVINLGNYANDGTGDDLRTAFQKVNANFAQLGNGEVHDGVNLGTGARIFKQRNSNANLEFKTLESTDSSVTFTQNADTVDISSVTTVQNDSSPVLGGDLSLDGNRIYGPGDVQSTINGIDVTNLNTIVTLLLASNYLSLNVDFGSWVQRSGATVENPQGYNLDMGTFSIPGGPFEATNTFDFGSFA